MKKIIFLALFLLAVNSIFAQKATQKPDGSWVLDGVQMTQDDKKALLNLLRPYETSYKLLEVMNQRTVATYGKANISEVTIDNKSAKDVDAQSRGKIAFVKTVAKDVLSEFLIWFPNNVSKAYKDQLNAIMAKYAR